MARKVKDALGREVTLPLVPQRVVSLVPSQTELLFDLGAGDRVVGRTKFCVHPATQVGSVPSIGGTKRIDPKRIIDRAPDLVLANKEENERKLVEALEAERIPVWVSDVSSIEESIALIHTFGELLALPDRATRLVAQVQRALGKLPSLGGARVLYLIWQEPYMGVGGDTYIDAMLRQLGGVNLLSERARYPEISSDEFVALRPDWIFLSSEPFPFKQQHVAEYQQRFPAAKALRVDGELFSWFGTRILHAESSIRELAALPNLAGGGEI